MNKANIKIIHGNDISGSRKVLEDEKRMDEKEEKVYLDGGKIILTDLVLASQSLSFLSENKLLIIENFVKGGITKNKQEMIDFIRKGNDFCRIVIWEDREIDKKILTKFFKDERIIKVNFPPLLFKFVDSLGGITPQTALNMFHDLLKEKEAEIIFAMIVRQIRLLILVKGLGENGLSSMAPWQVYKLKKQASFFNSIDNLVFQYRQLLSIDIKLKRGLTPYNLVKLLDIFLITF